MVKRVILNVENELELLDIIYRKYIVLPSNMIFIKNNRYPVVDKHKHNLTKFAKLNMLSNEPFHPFICLPTVLDVIKLYIYSSYSKPELYTSNPLLKDKSYQGEQLINSFNVDAEDIIVEHLPNVSKSDFDVINKTLNKIYDIIQQYTSAYDNFIFDLESETSYLILVNKGDVRAFRFEEYQEYIKYN